MSVVGSPIEASLVQTAAAQQVASRTRDRERAGSEAVRRYEDQLDLRVAGVEGPEAVRALPHNDSEQAGSEQESRGGAERWLSPGDVDEQGRPRVDVRA